jgi:hypothetical protein
LKLVPEGFYSIIMPLESTGEEGAAQLTTHPAKKKPTVLPQWVNLIPN